jgi:hypothetical protein
MLQCGTSMLYSTRLCCLIFYHVMLTILSYTTLYQAILCYIILTLNAFGFSRGMTFLHFCCKGCLFLIFCILGQPKLKDIYIECIRIQWRNDFSAFLVQRVSFSAFSAFWGNPNSRTYTLNAFGFSRGMTFLHFCCKGCPFLHFLHFLATQIQGG